MMNSTKHPEGVRPGTAKFITVEGGHGVGKSTLISHLCRQLRTCGVPVVSVADLASSALGRELREIALREPREALRPLTEALLIAAARHQNVVETIKPSLERGALVLSERFNDAFFAFQGAGRGLPTSLLDMLAESVAEGLDPHLTILLDADPRIALSRVPKTERHRIEREPLNFHNRVRQGYLERARAKQLRTIVLNAERSAEAIFNDAWCHVQGCIGATSRKGEA
jgi:dTMP kinase